MKIHNIKVWNRAISQEEVQAEYDNAQSYTDITHAGFWAPINLEPIEPMVYVHSPAGFEYMHQTLIARNKPFVVTYVIRSTVKGITVSFNWRELFEIVKEHELGIILRPIER